MSTTEPTEIIEPSATFRLVTIGTGADEMQYVQKPLSFFGKMQFFAVMGKALDRAMAGEDGISLADLLEVPDDAASLREADTFIRGIAKVAADSPEIMSDLYCVILGIPKGTWKYAKDVMQLPEEHGGLSEDQGFGILETFVEQNWDAIVSFFVRAREGLGTKIAERISGEPEASASSKRSRTTARTTRSQSQS